MYVSTTLVRAALPLTHLAPRVAASNVYNESDTLTKFEVMDGAPVRGESIPIRLYLSGFELTPTYRNIAQKYSVRYYLNLVLVDEEERRYFKQQEITLYRQELA